MLIPLLGEIEQHSTDPNEAAPNDVYSTTDTYCTILTLCLVMEPDSTLLERNIQLELLVYHKEKMLNVSSLAQTIQSYHNYSRCCL